MARPTSFSPEYVEQARKLCGIMGATDFEVAQFLGVTERTIGRWKVEHPEFAKALVVGKDIANERVKQALYRSAVGYTHEEMRVFCSFGKVTKVKTTKHYAPNPTSIIFFLCNREKEFWKQRNTEDASSDLAPLDDPNPDIG